MHFKIAPGLVDAHWAGSRRTHPKTGNGREEGMKLASLMFFLAPCALPLPLPAVASQQKDNPGAKDDRPEVNVVLRISRKVVNELTTKKIERTTPISMQFMETEI